MSNKINNMQRKQLNNKFTSCLLKRESRHLKAMADSVFCGLSFLSKDDIERSIAQHDQNAAPPIIEPFTLHYMPGAPWASTTTPGIPRSGGCEQSQYTTLPKKYPNTKGAFTCAK